MSIALACTWVPRGEASRLEHVRSLLQDAYAAIVVTLPPNRDLAEAAPLETWSETTLAVSPQPFFGRYVAIQKCATLPVTHVHYADLDMLVRWVEDRPAEWQSVVERIQKEDCLITGRSERAFQTRPQAIQQTETVINDVGSYLLGQPVDLGLGSRGFSRQVARIVVANSQPGGFGDLEWPILAQRAGFRVTYLEVDGVDWETPDQFRAEAADPATRQELAQRYDQRADRWELRVQVAQEIIREGIAAKNRPLTRVEGFG